MRTFNHELLEVIQNRWSPRAFSSEAVNKDDLEAILEAASYAPSCFNEQPWRYIVAEGELLETLQSLLLPRNHLWASKAPVLMLLISKSTFKNDKTNHYHQFDAGTSWGFLSLEATQRGYYTHAMAGFKRDEARTLLNIPDDYTILAMIALGHPGKIEELDDLFKAGEKPNDRKPLDKVVWSVKEFLNE